MADYAITNVARRVVYTGSAGVGPYAFSFPVLTATDIAVYKNTTLLTLTTDYTVTISGTTGTGSITLVVAATGADRITIVGARSIERSTDFVTGGDFFANTLNTELDSEVIFVQQVAETAERSIKAPVTDPTSINMTLPANTTRANKFLSFNSTGNPQAVDSLGAYKGNWATGTAYVLQDIVKDTSNSNIYICITAHTSTGSQPISSNADVAKWSLMVDAASAGTSATAAAASASAASTSASNAASSASAASTSASNASTSASSASTSASNASTSASNAASSASSASGSASTASTQASNASTSATNAAASASAASTSATNAANSASTATTQASNASTSATNAANSATSASGFASSASTQAGNAATSASNAATSETNAASSASAAATSASNAATTYDAFDDRYLGSKSSNPALDNDGNALLTGALYWNTTNNQLYVYTGSAWSQAYFAAAGAVSSFNTRTGAVTLTLTDVTNALTYTPLAPANNLSDVNSNATARTNLGLGSIATQASSNVSITGGAIAVTADPANALDVATKQYVDAAVSNLHIHDSVAAATTAALSGVVTYDNGTSGVGATLTLGTALTTLDGWSLSNGDRILVKNQATSAHNGVYTWATGGTVLTRATNADQIVELNGGDFFFVVHGTVNGDTGWVITAPVTTIGSSNVTFAQFSGAGTYTAGTGLTLVGTQFSVTDPVATQTGNTGKYLTTDGSTTSWGSISAGASAGGVIWENALTISSNYTLSSSKNGLSVGPIAINSGVAVTIPSGQRWVVL